MNLCRLKDEGKEETLTSGQISTPKEGSKSKKRVSWKENLTTSVYIEKEENEQAENDLLFGEALYEQELSLNMPITSLEQLLLPRKSTDNEQKR